MPDVKSAHERAAHNFRLGKLNQFGDDFVGAEMVEAFLTSREYENRFGQ